MAENFKQNDRAFYNAMSLDELKLEAEKLRKIRDQQVAKTAELEKVVDAIRKEHPSNPDSKCYKNLGTVFGVEKWADDTMLFTQANDGLIKDVTDNITKIKNTSNYLANEIKSMNTTHQNDPAWTRIPETLEEIEKK